MEKSIKRYNRNTENKSREVKDTGFYRAIHSKKAILIKSGTRLPVVKDEGKTLHLYAELSGWGNKVREVIEVLPEQLAEEPVMKF